MPLLDLKEYQMRYEHSKDIFTREIMDLWEAAYDGDNFVCLFNREETVSRNYLQPEHQQDIIFWKSQKDGLQ